MRKAYTVASGVPAVAVIATFWWPAVSDELRPMKYKVTVMEQVHHEITVEAEKEYAD